MLEKFLLSDLQEKKNRIKAVRRPGKIGMLGRDERERNPKSSSPFNLIWTQSTLAINSLMGLYNSRLRQGRLAWNHTLKRVRRDPKLLLRTISHPSNIVQDIPLR